MDRLADAVPMLMEPGDVGMHDRSVLHGAYPNNSKEPRVTLQFGFHNRKYVLGTEGTFFHASKRFDEPRMLYYDEAYIHQRSRMVQIAIDARKQRYPSETPYVYKPFVGEEERNRFNEAGRKETIEEYWRYNIS